MKNEMLIEVMSECTGKTVDEIRRVFQRDLYMTPQEAAALGIIDHVTAKLNLPKRAAKQSQSLQEGNVSAVAGVGPNTNKSPPLHGPTAPRSAQEQHASK